MVNYHEALPVSVLDILQRQIPDLRQTLLCFHLSTIVSFASEVNCLKNVIKAYQKGFNDWRSKVPALLKMIEEMLTDLYTKVDSLDIKGISKEDVAVIHSNGYKTRSKMSKGTKKRHNTKEKLINKLEKAVEEMTRLFHILEALLDVLENILKDKINKLEKEVEEMKRLFHILETLLDFVENLLKDKASSGIEDASHQQVSLQQLVRIWSSGFHIEESRHTQEGCILSHLQSYMDMATIIQHRWGIEELDNSAIRMEDFGVSHREENNINKRHHIFLHASTLVELRRMYIQLFTVGLGLMKWAAIHGYQINDYYIRQSGSEVGLPFIYIAWRTITALEQETIGLLITLQPSDFNNKDETNQKDQNLRIDGKQDRQSGSEVGLPFIYIAWRTITALEQETIGLLITLQPSDFNNKDETNQKDQNLRIDGKQDSASQIRGIVRSVEWENSSSFLLNHKFTITVQKIRGSIKTGSCEKGPRMFVHGPQIFADALRNAGIEVSRLSGQDEDEDLINYQLHFPSGCRMVIAVPMKIPCEKSKKSKAMNNKK